MRRILGAYKDYLFRADRVDGFSEVYGKIIPQFSARRIYSSDLRFVAFCDENFEGRRGKPSEEGDGIVTYSEPTESMV